MTRETLLDKARLGAFVDGELSPEDAAEVVMHLADHPGDQAYVDDLMAANAALAKAFADVLEEPVPPALHALILRKEQEVPARVIPFRHGLARRASVMLGGGLVGGALAAGLVFGLFLPPSLSDALRPGPLASQGDVPAEMAAALSNLPTGVPRRLADGSDMLVLATLPTPDGFCREVELIRPAENHLQAALACGRDGLWSIEVVIAERLSDASAAPGFGTASGEDAQAFSAFLDRLGAGAALDPTAEAAVIARAWAR